MLSTGRPSLILLSLALAPSACDSEVAVGSAQVTVSTVQDRCVANRVSSVWVIPSNVSSPSASIDLEKTGEGWEGLIENIPVGTNRTFLAQAFDFHHNLLLEGSSPGVPISANETAHVAITLQNSSVCPWAITGSMSTPRSLHTATLLPNGKILVVGGDQAVNAEDVATATAELYDPATGIWSVTGSMATPRYHHTATLLPSGKVLVVGGKRPDYPALASAELYDPVTGVWTSTNSMISGRYFHSATLLPNGKVLVAAGSVNSFTSVTAELYDPATGTWSATGSLAGPRVRHTATLLNNGKVLVAGGYSGPNSLATAELFDPATGTWSATGTMVSARSDHNATLLPSGKVLVGNGAYDPFKEQPILGVQVYDPATGTWSPPAAPSYGAPLLLLPTGEVLFVTPPDNNNNEPGAIVLYNPTTGTWNATDSWSPNYGTATLLPNKRVLFTGGYGEGGATATAELLTP